MRDEIVTTALFFADELDIKLLPKIGSSGPAVCERTSRGVVRLAMNRLK